MRRGTSTIAVLNKFPYSSGHLLVAPIRHVDALASLTEDDVSNEGLPFGRAKHIALGSIPVLAVRISYVGELGWELHCPMEHGLALWDAVWEAGQPHGIGPAGIGGVEGNAQEPPPPDPLGAEGALPPGRPGGRHRTRGGRAAAGASASAAGCSSPPVSR